MPKTISKKVSNKTQKTPKKAVTAVRSDSGARKFIPDSFRSGRLRRKATRQEVRQSKLPNAFKLFGQSVTIMTRHWEVFGGLLLIYALFNLILIGGISGGSDLQAIKDSLGGFFGGKFGQVTTGLTLFGFLVTSGTGTTASGVASAYQTILLILTSLALIWSLRQLYGGYKVRVRDGLYRGMYPLIPFILVLLFIGLQLFPALLGSFLFSSLVSGGILSVVWQQVIVIIISFLLLCLTIYWLCSSLVALYVVTLPDMTPWRAITMARDIVKYRRAAILRKLLFLPVAILVPAAVIMIPITLFVTVAAVPVFFVVSVLAVGVVNSYLYALYRELID